MSGIISPFQMISNKVKEFKLIQFEINDEYEQINVNLRANFNEYDFQEDNKYSAKLDLTILIQGITDLEQKVFEIQLIMQGTFSGEINSIGKEQFTDMLSLNGVSTLMQLSRAYVTSVAAALSGFPMTLNFPMINIFELNKLNRHNKEIDE